MKRCKECNYKLEGYDAKCDTCGACQENGFSCSCEVETVRVRPLMSYELVGTDIKLKAGRVYTAQIASNQPNYKRLGLVFVDGIVLKKGEYSICEA